MQGGIHPSFTGQSYLDLLAAAKAGAPDIHVHAFSPLEVRLFCTHHVTESMERNETYSFDPRRRRQLESDPVSTLDPIPGFNSFWFGFFLKFLNNISVINV